VEEITIGPEPMEDRGVAYRGQEGGIRWSLLIIAGLVPVTDLPDLVVATGVLLHLPALE